MLDESNGQCFWPERLVSHPDFNRQIKSQKNLLRQVSHIFAALPLHLTLADGLDQGLITETEVENLCNLLASQLESDEVQKRLSLYLPFELLCPITSGSMSVKQASVKFQTAYRSAWESQLSQHEVRANYVDGDVLEPELLIGDHPRVVKAAHLIPRLLQVGHLTVEDLLAYGQNSTDPLLTGSINAAELVAADLGLFEPDMVTPALYNVHDSPVSATGMTESRARWLASVAEKEVLRKKTGTIALLLQDGAHVCELASDQELAIALEAVRLASLQNAAVYNYHREWLGTLIGRELAPNTRDSLTKLCAHMHSQGLVNEDDLKQWDIVLPHLGGPFYPNRHRLQPTVAEILGMCKQAAEHPRLSGLVYPIALILGSRVKGYGLTEADCDIAVFVRPGVDRDERQYLEQELTRVYAHQHFDGDVKLFWLSEVSQHFGVIDWSKPAPSDAHSSWIYVLFGALWFGEKKQLGVLHQKLLAPYFSAPKTELQGKPVYERWLEEMERDSLQYRLLHKGFERFYPIQSPMDTKHGNVIDGQSAFYDPQYRRIATELFMRRVFLPKL
jgi:hypothetical protein